MTGTEKQIIWAEQIKAEAIGKLERESEARREALADPSKSERARERHQTALAQATARITEIQSLMDAAWIISNRSSL